MYLDAAIIYQIQTIASYFPDIERILLFGSRIRGDHSKTSDIDLAVYTTGDLSEFIYCLETDVTTLLEFDVTAMNQVEDDFFKEHVEKEGQIIYERLRL